MTYRIEFSPEHSDAHPWMILKANTVGWTIIAKVRQEIDAELMCNALNAKPNIQPDNTQRITNIETELLTHRNILDNQKHKQTSDVNYLRTRIERLETTNELISNIYKKQR